MGWWFVSSVSIETRQQCFLSKGNEHSFSEKHFCDTEKTRQFWIGVVAQHSFQWKPSDLSFALCPSQLNKLITAVLITGQSNYQAMRSRTLKNCLPTATELSLHGWKCQEIPNLREYGFVFVCVSFVSLPDEVLQIPMAASMHKPVVIVMYAKQRRNHG